MSLLRLALESLTPGQELYHYSDQKYMELKTREMTTRITEQDRLLASDDVMVRKMPGAYYEHISFFFERPPLSKMSRVFGHDHPFWYPGHEIYEHVVSIDDLPGFAYLVTESPDVTEFFYDERNDKLSNREYFEKVYQIRKRNHEIGDDLTKFKAVLAGMKGLTEKNYLALPDRSNFAEIKSKYAATVPHVMLYPKGGIIRVQSVNQVTVR